MNWEMYLLATNPMIHSATDSWCYTTVWKLGNRACTAA